MMFPIFAVYFDTRRLATYTVLAFVLGSLLGGAMWNFGGIYMPDTLSAISLESSSLNRFTSYEELRAFLRTRTKYSGVVNGRGFGFDISGETFSVEVYSDSAKAAADAVDSLSETVEPLLPDFSGTNIQVEGVDEADIVKTDGWYIYLATEDTIMIVRAYPPEEAKVVTRLQLYQMVNDMFVCGNKLVVFLTMSKEAYRDILGSEPPLNFITKTTVQVYDVSDRSSPTLEREVTVDGNYFNSRMIGDYVYVIVKKRAAIKNEEVVLPCFSSKKSWWDVEPTDIYYVNYTDTQFYFTNILAINTQDPESRFSSETFLLGAASNLYVSLGNIYITAGQSGAETTIFKIYIDEGAITYVADGSVPGRVLNQFSMDEHEGYFRIATTNGWVSRGGSSSSSNVYILNETLGIVGSLEGLAPGEEIYSARFMEKRCYLVTFKKVDPLFAIDLSDHTEPKILGKLKIPGYSDYLHPYDENHLIGLGKETVEAEDGDFAWHQGLKISLFDVSDVTKPKELAKYVVGDRGTESPALHDHKAFLFTQERNLLVIPILVSEIDPESYSGKIPPTFYGDFVFQGAYVFNISPEEGISVRGRITHLDEPDDLLRSGYWFESEYSVERSLYIDDILYTISSRLIKMNSLTDISELRSIDIS